MQVNNYAKAINKNPIKTIYLFVKKYYITVTRVFPFGELNLFIKRVLIV